jgi:tetraacyldisaccharide 4'-kinase
MNFKSKITKIHYDKNSRNYFLEFLSMFYCIAVFVRNKLYDWKILPSVKVDAYVISVGNLTTGGVGKTPVVAELAKYFIASGKKTAIISRGYGGKLSNKTPRVITENYSAKDVGDEPYWFFQNIKGAIVITCKNRVDAANTAIKDFQAEVIILDDAYQHRKIQRDLDIVLADSEKRFGNEKLLPAGPLRENLKGLERADKFVVVNKSIDDINDDAIVCNIRPDYVYNIKTGERLNSSEKAIAICAIGQPEQFYAFLKDFEITEKITFDDHHLYELNDIENITGNIITTEKDAVKLKEFNKDDIFALKLRTELDIERLLND